MNLLYSTDQDDLELTAEEVAALHRLFKFATKPAKSTVVYFACPVEELRMICFEHEIKFIRVAGYHELSIGAFDLRNASKLVSRLQNKS